MLKKFLAILLTFIFATNFLSVSAKTAEEKAAEKQANKEFKLQQKREKELAKIARRTNILKVEQWAEGGDVQAQMILSYAYSTGQRVDRNKKIAAQWQDKVAANNEDLVKNFIPLEYLYTKVKLPRLYGLAACRSQIGQYVPQNFDDALRWAELGASEFDTLSFAILGSAYYTGRGVRQDYKKALEFLKKAGDEPIALALLSDAYAKGNGVDKDLEKSKFYADYSKSVVQPKIDKQREKNQKRLDKQLEKEKKKEAQLEKQKHKPTTEEKPADDIKPSTEEKPADDNKPSTEEKPADDIKPSTEEKPTDDIKPSTEQKPADDNKPSTEEKPTDDNKSSTEQKPTDENKPTTEEKPIDANKPSTEEKPIDDIKPSTEEKPIDDNKPTDQNIIYIDKPFADKKTSDNKSEAK